MSATTDEGKGTRQDREEERSARTIFIVPFFSSSSWDLEREKKATQSIKKKKKEGHLSIRCG